MKTEETPEIIEILDDDIDRFGDRTQTTVHDTGGPRWIGPVAGIALIALIGYGVATSASTSSVPKVAPAPSTTVHAPATTVPAPTTTAVPKPPVPYYAASPPREYVVQFAEIQDFDSFNFYPGSYQLWATDGASATSGSWFSIQSLRTGPQAIAASNAYRVDNNEPSLAISHMLSGNTITNASIDDLMSVTITSYGWTDVDLLRLVRSISLTGLTEGNDVQIDDPTLTSGYALLTSVQPRLAINGSPIENIYYTKGGDPYAFLTVNVAQRPTPQKGGRTLDRQIALRFLLDHGTTFDVDGHIGTAGEFIDQPGSSVATWISGDHIVTVSAEMPVDQLVSIAATVHQVSLDEWNGMRFQATKNGSDFSFDSKDSLPVPVSFGTDGDGNDWTISAGTTTYTSGPTAVTWSWPGSGSSWPTEETPTIHTVVLGDRTYVLAELPRAVAATGQLMVSRAGLDPVLVPFVDTEPTFDHTFAAFAFSELGPYTAQIIGPDGAVLANWPAT